LVDSRAAPSGLTVTITGVAGQSGMSGIVLDLEGVASEHARAFSAKLNAPSTSMISPAIASVPADDLVLGLFGAYYDGETYSAPTGWNMDAFTGDDQCAAVAIDWRQTRGASTVKATVTSSGAEPYFAGALVLQPKGKGSN
ncbi:MAG TPA: hypothetical protein VEH29_08975, partial [Acidimicrobiales bacterium]|nr:hypothetical protein [Acidimicrobiales bacterium]